MLEVAIPLSQTTLICSQVLAGIAFICNLASFQRRERTEILLLFMGASVSLGIHFWLLQQFTALLLMLLAALRYLIAISNRSHRWSWTFVLVAIAIGVLTYERPANLFAVLGSSLGTWASFQAHDKHLRLWTMGSSAAWITHNWLVWTPMGLFIEVFFLGSNFLGYYRYYLRRLHW